MFFALRKRIAIEEICCDPLVSDAADALGGDWARSGRIAELVTKADKSLDRDYPMEFVVKLNPRQSALRAVCRFIIKANQSSDGPPLECIVSALRQSLKLYAARTSETSSLQYFLSEVQRAGSAAFSIGDFLD